MARAKAKSALAHYLRLLRVNAGMQQKEAAKALGLSTIYVIKIEAGEASPSLKTAIQQDATIDTIVSSLIVLVYGAVRQIAEPEEARRNLVHCLQAQLQADICVIHGSVSCLVGLFGAETYCSFGVHVPGFSGLLGRLATLPLGEVVEVTSS